MAEKSVTLHITDSSSRLRNLAYQNCVSEGTGREISAHNRQLEKPLHITGSEMSVHHRQRNVCTSQAEKCLYITYRDISATVDTSGGIHVLYTYLLLYM